MPYASGSLAHDTGLGNKGLLTKRKRGTGAPEIHPLQLQPRKGLNWDWEAGGNGAVTVERGEHLTEEGIPQGSCSDPPCSAGAWAGNQRHRCDQPEVWQSAGSPHREGAPHPPMARTCHSLSSSKTGGAAPGQSARADARSLFSKQSAQERCAAEHHEQRPEPVGNPQPLPPCFAQRPGVAPWPGGTCTGGEAATCNWATLFLGQGCNRGRSIAALAEVRERQGSQRALQSSAAGGLRSTQTAAYPQREAATL